MTKLFLILYFAGICVFMYTIDYTLHVDEFIGYGAGVKFAVVGHFTPNFLLHGIMNPLATECYIRLSGFFNCFKNIRGLQVFFGIIVIFLTYLIGSKTISRTGGFCASFLVASSPVFVRSFHHIFPDNGVAFFYLLATYILIKSDQEFSLPKFTMILVCLGLMIASKPAAMIFLPGFFLGLLLFKWEKFVGNKPAVLSLALYSIAVLLVTLLLVMPQAFLYPHTVQKIMDLMVEVAIKGEINQEISRTGLLGYWKSSFTGKFLSFWMHHTLPVVVVGLIGSLMILVFHFFRGSSLGPFEMIIVIPFWIHMTFLSLILYSLWRYFVPLIPLMCLAATWIIFIALARLPWQFVRIILIGIVFIFPGLVRMSHLLKYNTSPAPIYELYEDLRGVVKPNDTVKLWLEPDQFIQGKEYFPPYASYPLFEGGLSFSNKVFSSASKQECDIIILHQGEDGSTRKASKVIYKKQRHEFINRIFPTWHWILKLKDDPIIPVKQFVVIRNN